MYPGRALQPAVCGPELHQEPVRPRLLHLLLAGAAQVDGGGGERRQHQGPSINGI